MIERRRLETFEMRYYRKILKMLRCNGVTNEYRLKKFKEKRRFRGIVNYRRDNTICHILCIDDVIKLLIIKSYTEYKTGRNRLRIRYILEILKDVKMKSDSVLNLNFNREETWKML